MNILGISAFYHDSAACLVRDGEIVAAAQEERFTRKKHDQSFPKHAVEYCLAEAGIKTDALDVVAFYDKPLLKFDRLLETFVVYWPTGFKMFLKGLPAWTKQKLYTPREIDRGLGGSYEGRYVFLEHHESHAASAYFPSPFDQAAIVTLDGVGEWTTGSIALGNGNKIELLRELHFPHSLGLLYSAFTHFAGFTVNSGEYKLMGLAPYGRPVYKDLILKELVDLKDDGSFKLNMKYFGYCNDDVMTLTAMETLLEGLPRAKDAAITSRETNIAASIQAVTEEIMLRIARHAHSLTAARHLVMAGGVALNCVANGKLLREGPFEDIWIQPAAGDAGGALGAATFVWHQLLDNPRKSTGTDRQHGSLLGPAFTEQEVRRYLDSVGAAYTQLADEDTLAGRIAELISSECVVGHFAGRMEFGPRALGSRSILGDPRSPTMQSVINSKIKFRESFRPFGPAVLLERAHEYFELVPGQESPYMMLVAGVRAEHRVGADACNRAEEQATTGASVEHELETMERLRQVRSSVPAITHVDYSARVQTVDAQRFPRFYRIIKAFEKRTGCPLVINTSFNVRGEPIVHSPADAYRCFMATDMDALVIENFLLLREQQPQSTPRDRATHLSTFAPD